MGGYRLGKKVGKDIDLIITKDNFQSKDLDKSEEEINKILTILERSDIITYVIEKGKVKLTLLIKVKSYPYQVHLDLRLAPKDLLPYFSLYFGSGEFFSRKIRQIAKDKGYKLNEYGLTDLKTNKKIILKSEKDIFKFLGVDYVTPINRL